MAFQSEEVVHVSNSDVLCLEGINDRLWSVEEMGPLPCVYSIESYTWVMTNNWAVHWNGQTPMLLQKIAVDPYSIDKIGTVVSTGNGAVVGFVHTARLLCISV